MRGYNRVFRNVVAGTGCTKVFVGVWNGATTHAELIAETGLCRATVNQHLRSLRRHGLVTWDEGKHGTIRPAVREVAFG